MDVKNWLVEEGIFKSELPDEVAEWHYVVEFPPDSRQVTDIIKPKGKNIVLIISGLVLAENHYRALHSLPADKKRNLIHKWKMDLLFRKAEFRMMPDAENVQRIDFSIPIYLEELTKPKLFEALREIFKCKLYVIWNLHHEFDRKGDVDAMYL